MIAAFFPKVLVRASAPSRARLAAALACALFSLLAVRARGDAPAARAYALGEVLRRAATSEPAVLLALETLRRVRAEQSLAEAAYLPAVAARGSGGALYDNRLVIPGQPRIDSKGLDARGTLGLEWTLLDRTRRGGVRAARSATAAQREDALTTRQRALAAALELFLTALTADELVADAELTLARRLSQHEAIAGLVRAGVRPSVDERRAQIEVLDARAVLKRRALERDAGRAALAAAMGDDPLSPARPAPLERGLASPQRLEEALRLAAAGRPETRAAAHRVGQKRAELAAAIGARLPTVGLSGAGNVNYMRVLTGQGIEGTQYDVSGALYIQWAALDARAFRRGRAARAALEEAEQALKQAAFEVRREVVAAHYALRTAETRLEQAVAVLGVAAATREAQNERYRAGLSSLLELLDAEDVEQRARLGRIEAQLARLTAEAELLRACGLVERLMQR